MTIISINHDTEDKQWWCTQALADEIEFANRLEQAGHEACINPQKRLDKYAPDLIVNGRIADLKCQKLPFFRAQELYSVDPQYAVSFNLKDMQRYRAKYPTIVIYFWANWSTTEMDISGIRYTVQPMSGIWRAELPEIESQTVHTYNRRVNDNQGNAKASYVVDLRYFEQILL